MYVCVCVYIFLLYVYYQMYLLYVHYINQDLSYFTHSDNYFLKIDNEGKIKKKYIYIKFKTKKNNI